MASDDERREAAARLRALDIHDWYDCADEIDSLESAIECNVGQRFEPQSWWHRLADLVDRPTTRLSVDEDGRTCCASCGCSCLYMGSATYCPDCGAEVVSGDGDGGQ